MSQVRVRFAPSPTGYLHVGGARTAIFNWLYARRHGGVFVLRIEDTDRERSSDEMVQAILDGMDWLGMTPDEGPHFQSRAGERHRADARRLLDSGRAYRCFCDPDEIRTRRAEAEKAGLPTAYPRTCRDLPDAESNRRAEAGETHAVRFRVPGGNVAWDDAVHGPTSFEGSTIEDFVIVRSDGTPTYMLSVVSDDAAMEITHVIRGDDHLSNTPKQILLYDALGQRPPTFAHLPMILGEDRKRLSKRHGAVSVLEYREQGFLPDTMFNFLALLGWSPGDDRQKMDRDELVDAFDLGGVGKSPAIFDLTKLEWLNGQYIAEAALDDLEPDVRARLREAGLWQDRWAAEDRAWFRAVLELLRPRARRLPDLVTQGEPFFDPTTSPKYEPKAAKKHLKGDDPGGRLRQVRDRLAAVEPWSPGPLEDALRVLAEELDVSAGKLIHPTRLAVTGRGASPGLFEVLELIGRERSLARLDGLIAHVEARAGDS